MVRKFSHRYGRVVVLLLSLGFASAVQARNIVEAMRLGASDFLRKPFEVEELELAFQKALRDGCTIDGDERPATAR